MSPKLKTNLLKYGITSVVSLLLSLAYYLSFKDADMQLTRLLSDAFFVPGILIAGFGVLFYVSNQGIFDGLSYGLQMAFKALIPGGKLKKQKSYGDFKEEKEAHRVKGYGFILVVGIFDIAIATIFTILFHM